MSERAGLSVREGGLSILSFSSLVFFSFFAITRPRPRKQIQRQKSTRKNSGADTLDCLPPSPPPLDALFTLSCPVHLTRLSAHRTGLFAHLTRLLSGSDSPRQPLTPEPASTYLSPLSDSPQQAYISMERSCKNRMWCMSFRHLHLHEREREQEKRSRSSSRLKRRPAVRVRVNASASANVDMDMDANVDTRLWRRGPNPTE